VCRWRFQADCWLVPEQLAECNEISERLVIEPPALSNVLGAEVSDVGDGPAERRDAESKRYQKYVDEF